ncbi:predicted P-loop ATPase fused to an acetyltransferase COG1444 [Halorhodospira halochloris]|uniref:tRNA(Met) cytidine acetyltransferase TmcA n=1 Tax=Halorhodospira halochloris TaxID=1052 RepID=A0A0X8X8H1_HALHR|nr:GNAT family N-acetyltransferase [Halorhodospira halochloris]MBK1651248.1 hypothetical protein [Halorhodospira halochloris]BAU57525.1 predicted P-loop ATPase fused to an acetyltransferase COG1444 [Halorhodospira halochloris]
MNRRLVHLAGGRDWARQQARQALLGIGQESCQEVAKAASQNSSQNAPQQCQEKCPEQFPEGAGYDCRYRVLWLGEGAPAEVNSIAGADYPRLLGTTQDIIVFDAHDGLDPDALAAAAGALRGGGILVLLTPELISWPAKPDAALERLVPAGWSIADAGDRFIRRLVDLLRNAPWVECYSEGDALARLVPGPAAELARDSFGCCSSDQRAAVKALMRVVTGHRRRPVVLSADRGRGKSAALGIAIGELLALAKVTNVVVTAPRLAAAEPVFEHALQRCNAKRVSRREMVTAQGRLSYHSPQELLDNQLEADLLVVDEAAGLPVAVLTRLLRRFSRIAFSTTVHGYEGTGRGFDLRFRSVLDSHTPEWRLLRLETPIRWQAGDKLEQWLTGALLLDAEPAQLFAAEEDDARRSECGGDCHSVAKLATSLQQGEVHAERLLVLERVNRDDLVADERRLRQSFGLLVAAHYRTRPLDLRQWLDSPGIEIFWALLGDEVVGILVAVAEGGLDEQSAEQIWQGQRRLRGHLLCQMLSAHGGVARTPRYRALRIMRIAVHPHLRRRAIGSSLVKRAQAHAEAVGYSIFGTSFGGTTDLVAFWRSLGLSSVALGVQRDAASGEHAVLMAKGLDQAGAAITGEAGERLRESAEALLGEPLNRLEPGLAGQIFAAADGYSRPRLSAGQRRDLSGFAYGQRGYAASLPALKALAVVVLQYPEHIDQPSAQGGQDYCSGSAALIAKVLQRQDWQSVSLLLGSHGRQQGIAKLREYVANMLDKIA